MNHGESRHGRSVTCPNAITNSRWAVPPRGNPRLPPRRAARGGGLHRLPLPLGPGRASWPSSTRSARRWVAEISRLNERANEEAARCVTDTSPAESAAATPARGAGAGSAHRRGPVGCSLRRGYRPRAVGAARAPRCAGRAAADGRLLIRSERQTARARRATSTRRETRSRSARRRARPGADGSRGVSCRSHRTSPSGAAGHAIGLVVLRRDAGVGTGSRIHRPRDVRPQLRDRHRRETSRRVEHRPDRTAIRAMIGSADMARASRTDVRRHARPTAARCARAASNRG